MIKETNDYEIFKKHPSNAELIEGNIIKIMNSIKRKSLLIHRPILVDSEMRVIDGQHRLEAAKRLAIPVFYEIQDDLKADDMRTLNQSMRIWRRKDFLHFFAAEGYEEYVKLERFIKRNGVSLDNALVILGKSHGGGRSTKNGFDYGFQNGCFKYPPIENEEKAIYVINCINDFIDYIRPKMVGSTVFLSGNRLARAF